MKIKVSEVRDHVLDYLAAKAEGHEVWFGDWYAAYHSNCALKVSRNRAGTVDGLAWVHCRGAYSPSTNWAQGGPIIDREDIDIMHDRDRVFDPDERVEPFMAIKPFDPYHPDMSYVEYGPTKLIAAMRCFVISRLGEEVEVPEELLT